RIVSMSDQKRGYLHRTLPYLRSGSWDGIGGIPMMDDVLRIAGRALEAKKLNPGEFAALLNGILTHGEKCEQWQVIIESAYQRLAKSYRPGTRFLMMSYRSTVSDHAGVLQ